LDLFRESSATRNHLNTVWHGKWWSLMGQEIERCQEYTSTWLREETFGLGGFFWWE